jgi:hypothetical protein
MSLHGLVATAAVAMHSEWLGWAVGVATDFVPVAADCERQNRLFAPTIG